MPRKVLAVESEKENRSCGSTKGGGGEIKEEEEEEKEEEETQCLSAK